MVQRLQWKEDLYNCFCLFSLQGSDSSSNPEDSAAICIQKWFRGFKGRKIYITVFACFQGSDSSSSPEDSAAICIQKWFRGFKGRKIYAERLYEQFQKVQNTFYCRRGRWGGGGGHKLTTVNISAGRDVPIKGSHI